MTTRSAPHSLDRSRIHSEISFPPLGYCWTVTNVDQTRDGEVGKGRIHMLGVDPDYRGKGLGKQVLLAGLSLLKSRGLGHVDLTVDSENKAALALYESLGFAVRTRSLWCEKKTG